MRVWIMGRRGLLARAMQRKCKERGIDYVATSKKEVDLTNRQAVEAQFETLHFTHLINCAAYTAVDRAEEEEKEAHALNAEGVALLALLAHQHSKRLLHFSTDYVFNGKAERYKEEDPTDPLSIYGKSKAEGEVLLKKYCPEACLIRTSWLFGREGNHFVKKMIALLETQEQMEVVSDQIGRPTYADDLAEAALSLLDRSGTFHFANSGETSWHGFAEAIKRKLEERGRPIRCKRVEPVTSAAFGALAPRPASSILETERFSPPHWERGLEEVIAHALPS